ncbi:MAG: radical SAM protein [Candidatus Hydrogenedentes bacterium]|nr:radical SAM protein [Candidatus Hydrogenedentota bacterium]
MRIVLFNPPPVEGQPFIREGRCMQSVSSWAAIWPPLTLAYLAAIAREFGEVDLFDCNVEAGCGVDEAVARAKAFRPDVIVVNTAFPSIDADGACAVAVKAACPDAVVVGFGLFFTLLDEAALEELAGFDVGISGEPEMTFRELLATLDGGGRAAGLPGLMWREEGGVRRGPDRALMEELDVLPMPARDLLHNDRYVLPTNGRRFTLINAARGCPFRCIFCIAPAYYGHRVRRHSLEYVLAEMEYCQRELGIRDFLFWEEIFTLDVEFGLALCEAICEKGWDVSWAATTRVDRLTEELLAAMKRAGCFMLGLGIESSSQAILDTAEKQTTVEDARRAVALCRQAGIKTMGHFIFGLPGETRATAEATVTFARELGLDYVQCYAAVPYPKTKLGDMAKEQGWITASRWAEYDFGGKCVLATGAIAPEEVDEFRGRMFRRFYLRPLYLLGQFVGLLGHPRQLIQAAGFLRWMKPTRRPGEERP